jgi:hypothetical protein
MNARAKRLSPSDFRFQAGVGVFGCPHRWRLPENQAAFLESQMIHPIQYREQILRSASRGPALAKREKPTTSAARSTASFRVSLIAAPAMAD